ncbi:LOW QUALITY PROTEIN: hypothetical protein NLU13_7201 [Sarocladium strictum]|uniref:Uncharacterized protein n=1 Tax=Sarocladium strictum TaxID=5046 RepID=A0AA39L5B5_SARSR|nr:LOW QUALITY PROTEIN: hypothetical protein NLU13_7201 [Sarocladium strictum]
MAPHGSQDSPTYHDSLTNPDFRTTIRTDRVRALYQSRRLTLPRGGRTQLYYLDTRLDPETATHIKEQIERASIAEPDEVLSIDAENVTASLKNADDGRVVFTWDPPYGRVLWAHLFNKRRPELDLPMHAPAQGWEVTYDPETAEVVSKLLRLGGRRRGSDRELRGHSDGLRQAGRVDDDCDQGANDQVSDVESRRLFGGRMVDAPRLEGESDAEYYRRMDVLHWGVEDAAHV